MKRARRWIAVPVFVLASLVFGGRETPAAEPGDAVAATQAGSVRGRSEGELLAFKGLRFAAPPVGERRWRAPQLALPWQGTRPALERGLSRIQKPSLSIDSGAGDPRPMGEDCLDLSPWTPRAEPAARLPMMVWIHGGALIFGGGLPIDEGVQASAAELRAVPAEAFERLAGNEVSLAPSFIGGDAALPPPVRCVFQSGGEARVPLIIGNTSEDGSMAVAFGTDPAAIVKRPGAARIAVAHWFDFAATGSPVPRNAAAWPRDGQRASTLFEFGEVDRVQSDFIEACVNACIGTLKLLGAFIAAR